MALADVVAILTPPVSQRPQQPEPIRSCERTHPPHPIVEDGRPRVEFTRSLVVLLFRKLLPAALVLADLNLVQPHRLLHFGGRSSDRGGLYSRLSWLYWLWVYP